MTATVPTGPNGPNGGWDEIRIAAAYRVLVRRPMPPGLLDSAFAMLRPAPGRAARRSFAWSPFRRGAVPLVGAAAVLAVVTILVAGPVLRPVASPTPASASASPATSAVTPSPSPGTSAQPTESSTTTNSTARYPGGIPGSFDGEPVYLGLGAVIHADGTTDATPFLAGGWLDDGTREVCTGVVGPSLPETLRIRCFDGVQSSAPWGPNSYPGVLGPLAWNGHSLPAGFGPAIVRVHTHDPLAAECTPQMRAWCEGTLVVDDVLWTGDAWTAGSPISVAEAVRRLEALLWQYTQSAQSTFVVPVGLAVTARSQACPYPWPNEVFDLHGDPRFGLLAVFPSEAARVTAQATLDPAANDCPTDPRIVRPGDPIWVGHANVLVLVYDSTVANGTEKALSIPFDFSSGNHAIVPQRPSALDESYRVILDFLAMRESGDVEWWPETHPGANVDPAYDSAAYILDVERRYTANALSFSIGPARPVAEGDVDPVVWQFLSDHAAPGTPRLFEVDHPQSTDPALRQEVFVVYHTKAAVGGYWQLLLVQAAPWPTPSGLTP